MPRPVAFTHDGVEYKAFPGTGCFWGIGSSPEWHGGRPYLLCVAMLHDGSPESREGQPDPIEVSNMWEEGDVELLESINAEFGTHFKQTDFAGR